MGPSERSDVLGSESIQTRLADEGIRPGKICLENASVLAAPCEICLKPVARACREEADLGIDDIDADVTRTKPVPGIDLMLETAL